MGQAAQLWVSSRLLRGRSEVDSVGSEELVGLVVAELEVGAGLDLVGLADLDAVLERDRGDLDLVVGLLVPEEHDLHAALDELAGLLLSHISPPVVGEEHGAVVVGEAGEQVVLALDLGAVEVALPQEDLIIKLVNAGDDDGDPERVALESPLILGPCDPVEVVLGVEEAGAVVLNQVLLVLLSQQLLEVLEVGHLARARKYGLLAQLVHP
mmetsp:Transcript_7442/g.12574  ORF Transcript_7442/g.12574 Transcript_7442/m.12574 type:complete len:211 (+) Transcript_7442:25-657(+)